MWGWRRANNKLTEFPLKGCRQPNGGHWAPAPDMEEAHTAWIEELRSSHARVTRTSRRRPLCLGNLNLVQNAVGDS